MSWTAANPTTAMSLQGLAHPHTASHPVPTNDFDNSDKDDDDGFGSDCNLFAEEDSASHPVPTNDFDKFDEDDDDGFRSDCNLFAEEDSERSSQPAPMKVLTRSIFSGQYPATDFSYIKARPLQLFDFQRPKQLQSPPPSNIFRTIKNVINFTDHQIPSLKHVFKDSLSMPFPNIISAHSRAYDHSIPNIEKNISRLNLSFSDTSLNETLTSADDVLTHSILYKTKSLLTSPISNHNLSEMIETVDKQSIHVQHRSDKTFKNLLTSVIDAPKITQSRRRKPKTGPTSNGSNRKDTYNEARLLRLLKYDQSQGQHVMYFKLRTERHFIIRFSSNRFSGFWLYERSADAKTTMPFNDIYLTTYHHAITIGPNDS